MRTDAKVGFAIGGVLLAVLAVYLIVVPRHNHVKKTVALVNADQGGGGSDNAASTASNSAQATSPVTLTGSGTPAIDGGTVAQTSPPRIVTPPPIAPDEHAKPLVDPLRATPHIADSNSAGGNKFHRAQPPSPFEVTSRLVSNAQPKSRSHRAANRRSNEVTVGRALTADHTVATTAKQYKIKSGQTLSSIASDVYGNARFWVAIERSNPGLDPRHLRVGQEVNLPDISDVRPTGPVLVDVVEPVSTIGGTDVEQSARTYRVHKGDSLYKIAKKLYGTGQRADALYNLNRDVIGNDEAKLKLGTVLRLPEATTSTEPMVVDPIAE